MENHYPVGSVGHPYRAGPNIRCAAVGRILACSLQRLVTLGDYSLPGRFISDCICSSRQCPPALFVSSHTMLVGETRR